MEERKKRGFQRKVVPLVVHRRIEDKQSVIIFRRFNDYRRSIFEFREHRGARLGFHTDVGKKLSRVQRELGRVFERFEYVVIVIVRGQRDRRPAAILRDKNLLPGFDGQFGIAVPPAGVGVFAENDELSLSGLSQFVHAVTHLVRQPRNVINNDHLMPGNFFRCHVLSRHDRYVIGQIRRRRICLTQEETLPGASGIDNKNLQFFAPFQNKQKLIVQLQGIVRLDANLSF